MHSSFSTYTNTAKPSFTVRTDGRYKNVYQLHPYNRHVMLNASVSGTVVVDCSATGYPDPTYIWQLNGKDINDSCSRAEGGGKVWIFFTTNNNALLNLIESSKMWLCKKGCKERIIVCCIPCCIIAHYSKDL